MMELVFVSIPKNVTQHNFDFKLSLMDPNNFIRFINMQ